MPHRLRRIIAINIRNPKDGFPSGRIAELDPRGGAMAAGINGVGKTTFLRLLPLFYGATPQQILRGKNHSTMIRHTLPDASSTVVYEYERESEEDLRCVVMHCKPDDDAPQFHIIYSGFREDFFYDESNRFVTRDEFKPRVSAMGYEVTEKLFLHTYRSVILNESLKTNDGKRMLPIAARCSLGPKPLHNLDQIAAAMANEKLEFRDLQNIVIERVTDGDFRQKSQGDIPLKKHRKDVASWIEDRDHLDKVMKCRPEAERISARIQKIKAIHLQLCTFHIAVKEAIAQIVLEQQALDDRETASKAAFAQQARETEEVIEQMATEKAHADVAWGVKRDEVKAADARHQHFMTINVEQLSEEQGNEDSLKSTKLAAETEMGSLNEAISGVAINAQARKTTIEQTYSNEVARIDGRLLDAANESAARNHAVRDAEDLALARLETPARLAEIEAEKLEIVSRLGELKQLATNPVATPGALSAKELADSGVRTLAEGLQAAASATVAAQLVVENAKRACDRSIEAIAAQERVVGGLAAKISGLNEQFEPKPGSLLAFFRMTAPEFWSESAKLLDPALLARTDLQPVWGQEREAVAGVALLGDVELRVADVPLPAWIDLSELRLQLDSVRRDATAAATALEDLIAKANRLSAEKSQAEAALDGAKATESLAKVALDNAKVIQTRSHKVVQQEISDCKSQALSEQSKKQESIQRLNSEAARITTGVQAEKKRIRDDFAAQRLQIGVESRESSDRLKAEKPEALNVKVRALVLVDEDVARELSGLGVDPLRVANLQTVIDDAARRLARISGMRHEVAAWAVFSRDVLPSLESIRNERERLKNRLSDLGRQLSGLNETLERISSTARLEETAIEAKRAGKRSETNRLQDLLATGLKEFNGRAPATLKVDWLADELEADVVKSRKQLVGESEALHKEMRALRGVMLSRSSQIEQWVNGREAKLPVEQTLSEHEYRCEQAQILCDWFLPGENFNLVNALHKDMEMFFTLAGGFVSDLDSFDRRVDDFNRKLQKALTKTAPFERFKELSVTVRSGVGQLSMMSLLRRMQDVSNSQTSLSRSVVVNQREVPSDEDTALIRSFRDILPVDGSLSVNLNEQVRLECSLIENGKLQVIKNEREFADISSTGNTALITAMFLIGFVEMIRGEDSPVRLTWVTDEITRFDSKNLKAFLDTLDSHNIDVIGACASADPALSRHFPRQSIFDGNGRIQTSETGLKGVNHA